MARGAAATAHASPQGGPTSEQIEMSGKKREAPKESEADKETADKKPASFNLWGFFLLHLSSGLSGSFTTLLIAHLACLKLSPEKMVFYSWLLGTLEDVPPMVLAFLGGFLQQLLGPKKLLLAAGLPGLLSWLVVVPVYFKDGDHIVPCLLMSRILAGLSNSFLTGNVYMADTAPNHLVASFKQIEAASRSLGSILIFAIFLVPTVLANSDFWVVPVIASVFPLLGLISVAVAPESPIFLERKNALESVEEGEAGGWSRRVAAAKKLLKIPLRSPEVYRPLVLILSITCLQHFSGFTFTKKFLLQVVAPQKSTLNSTVPDVVTPCRDYTSYYFAMAINLLRFLANLLMARILVKIRIRLLFFLSLFATAICLSTLAFLLHPASQGLLPQGVDLYLRVTVLAIHVFSVQFGIQSLAGQMTDTLLPSHSKSILKGLVRSAQSISLFAFVSIMAFLPHSTAFWTMAGVLVLASPVLYVYIPELRSLGRAAGSLYFLPVQTKFYAVIPKDEDLQAKAKKAKNRFKKMASAVKMMADAVNMMDNAVKTNRSNKISFRRQMTVKEEEDHLVKLRIADRQASEDKVATFGDNTVEEILGDPKLKKENQLSVTLVRNMLPGTNNFLANHVNKDLILVARGPATFASGAFKKCGIFLFTDIMIVAQKVKKNRKYINARVFQLDASFTVQRDGSTVIFNDNKEPCMPCMPCMPCTPCMQCTVVLEPEANAMMWERYAKFCQARRQGAGTSNGIKGEFNEGTVLFDA